MGQHPPPSKRLNKAIPYPRTKSNYGKPQQLSSSCRKQGTLSWLVSLEQTSLKSLPATFTSQQLFQNGAIIQYQQKHGRERKQRTPGWEGMLTQVLQLCGPLWE